MKVNTSLNIDLKMSFKVLLEIAVFLGAFAHFFF